MGHDLHENCPSWRSSQTEDATANSASELAAAEVSWTGNAMGSGDLFSLVPRAQHRLIGVLGAQDSGKTTLLTASYTQLLLGQQLADTHFSGSRTLGAWEALASWMRFDDAARPPTFPPHTSRNTGRVPGLLHFALRNPGGEFRDILLTDAPGEWFKDWAQNEADTQAAGARWVVEQADAFILLADCDKLSGKARGPTRDNLRALIERLGCHAANRPVLLVWAKSDKPVPENLRNQIQATLKKELPHAQECQASITAPESLAKVVGTIISQCWNGPLATPFTEPVTRFEPFYAFRGHHGTA